MPREKWILGRDAYGSSVVVFSLFQTSPLDRTYIRAAILLPAFVSSLRG